MWETEFLGAMFDHKLTLIQYMKINEKNIRLADCITPETLRYSYITDILKQHRQMHSL